MTELIEKKSRFLSYVFDVSDDVEALSIIESVKKEHKRSKHVVYAYKINEKEKYDDAGEPYRTAGLPTLEAIRRRELDNILVVTIRYFGGILLGKGGLIRAYGKSAGKALDQYVQTI